MTRRAAVAAVAAVAWSNVVLPALGLSSRGRAAAGTAVALGATGVASAAGVSRRELGLVDFRSGLRWGSTAAAVPVVGYAVVAATPGLRSRLAVPAEPRSDFAEWVAVHIPFGTVLAEELLLRGVLTALTARAWRPAPAAAVRALVFGLWHVHPAREARDSVPATVAFTAASSLVFDWLRVRSGSVSAPAVLHLAVNAGGALLVRRIQAITGPGAPSPHG
ncbi:CPBP family intramembrane glutamic endopeptidase [Rhodococcus sp. SGAir0479]|uniref:CPBP family intramembrane glutamic endopeptidase n=1 Tax=Rhodococcus sp. SGAir0479 TaxID=2567884 RepID=UPI0010CCF45C|nr:CPBP family intramembrane glutamic endopeptidase [Rhodococcus sp. SGAir0479]QCQ89798.1 CPBP family intramembrane metalloprotease [Rhodococcus sp. SGAir0479]